MSASPNDLANKPSVSVPNKHITVCICTFKRPQLLRRLLEKVAKQQGGDRFDVSVVIVDNDSNQSAKPTVTEFARTSPVQIIYDTEPVASFARARNRAVANATGDFIAFIDDDEFPDDNWLLTMHEACEVNGVAGVLGPVLPHFETPPPSWLVKGGFYDRPRHQTGFVMSWQESRTGNVLFRRQIIEGVEPVFNLEFALGGEDQDFFRRMMEKGHRFIWCDEAPAYETVPPHRWKRSFLLKRALLRGRMTFTQQKYRWRNIGKSMIAAPLYLAALPLLLIAGHHLFMKYLIRLGDHTGRLLAMLSLNPIKERNN